MINKLVKTLMGSNQFASGGLLLMVVGAIMALLRKLPEKLWLLIVKHATVSITIKDDDSAFMWVKEWFINQPFTQKCRNVDLDTSITKGVSVLPAPGRHWFWYKKRPLYVDFSRQQETKGWMPKRIENFRLTILGRNIKTIDTFVEDVVSVHKKLVKDRSRLWKYGDSYWSWIDGYCGRIIDSVILPDREKEELLEDIDSFLKSEDRYKELGIPFHRGYLFYGPPGTGKTSLASAIATHLGIGLYIVNLNQLSDRSLVKAVNQVGSHSVVLLEDIDVMNSSAVKSRESKKSSETPEKESEEKLGVSMSGLLNVLDGVDSPHGVIFIMTTNKEDTLDPALVRAGRIDYQLHLNYATHWQKVELYQRFFPNSTTPEAARWVLDNPNLKTMAELQGVLLNLALEKKYMEAVV